MTRHEPDGKQDLMNASTLPRYLIGSRQAILDVAACRWSFVIGVLFVLSAGLAREYDGEDLVHEPWHALRPLAASLASGTALFLLVHLAALLNRKKAQGLQPGFAQAWKQFMGLFWLTAPMAWLYAVPYERFMSPVDAVKLNLCTLAIVALWRVLLISRVIQVLYGVGYFRAFFIVMLFADLVVFIVMTTVPSPVINIMGGLRHSERDELIANVTFTVTFFSALSAPVWIFFALIATALFRPRWLEFSISPVPSKSRGLLILAVASLVAFVPLLIISQPEQINRREAERLLKQGNVPKALAVMSERSQEDYPPHWNPPPKLGYRENTPSLIEVREAMSQDWPADWVATIYLNKIVRDFRHDLMPDEPDSSWTELAEEVRASREYGREMDTEQRRTAQFLLEHLPSLTETEQKALKQIAGPPTP